jgi:hypothetical protein
MMPGVVAAELVDLGELGGRPGCTNEPSLARISSVIEPMFFRRTPPEMFFA